MKIAFTTLGCPNWDLDTICRNGRDYGYEGVDFRGYRDTLDITKLPLFTTHAADTRKRLNDAGLEVCGISSSIRICDADAELANLDEARRIIETARLFGCENVRVFGGGNLKTSRHDELAAIGAETIEKVLELDEATELHWLFETHDNWIRASDCALLLNRIDHSAFGALWDMGHTARVGGETPEQSYSAIGARIGYIHVKDAVYDASHPQAMSDGWRYVLPGEGELPIADAVKLLRQHGYSGWLLFEHEKRWHPDLSEPETAFPAFVQWVRPLLA
jgi:sugar phosphate isomerase/epimerase